MKTKKHRSAKPGPRYLVAMVLGTALSALGNSASVQASEAPERTVRAVNAISRYCTVCWRNARLHPDSWTDCTQEVFARLLERMAPDTWQNVLSNETEERREFLRAIDTVKKRTQRARRLNNAALDMVPDPSDGCDREVAQQRAEVREAAAQVLTSRQRRVLEMSLDGWSVHDIAAELRLPADRISDEKYKAIRKLRERLDVGQASKKRA